MWQAVSNTMQALDPTQRIVTLSSKLLNVAPQAGEVVGALKNNFAQQKVDERRENFLNTT